MNKFNAKTMLSIQVLLPIYLWFLLRLIIIWLSYDRPHFLWIIMVACQSQMHLMSARGSWVRLEEKHNNDALHTWNVSSMKTLYSVKSIELLISIYQKLAKHWGQSRQSCDGVHLKIASNYFSNFSVSYRP